MTTVNATSHEGNPPAEIALAERDIWDIKDICQYLRLKPTAARKRLAEMRAFCKLGRIARGRYVGSEVKRATVELSRKGYV